MPSLVSMNATALLAFGKRLKKGQKQIVQSVEGEFDGYGRLLMQTMQKNAPRKTGTFASGMNYKVFGRGGANMELRVGWAPKGGQPKQLADWILFGTGIYGPRHRPIVPTKHKFLRFSVGGRVVFAKSVRGMKKRNFVGQSWSDTAGARQAMIGRIGKILATAVTGARGGGRAL